MDAASCWIYKSRNRDEMYLFVLNDGDFSPVPHSLLEHFGEPEFVMTLELKAGRRLARADAAVVLTQLGARGYYLQMPPSPEPHLILNS